MLCPVATENSAVTFSEDNPPLDKQEVYDQHVFKLMCKAVAALKERTEMYMSIRKLDKIYELGQFAFYLYKANWKVFGVYSPGSPANLRRDKSTFKGYFQGEIKNKKTGKVFTIKLNRTGWMSSSGSTHFNVTLSPNCIFDDLKIKESLDAKV